MTGSIIGTGLKAAGAIFGGISNLRTAKKISNNIRAQREKNQNWYDRRFNEDATQRADAQRLLTQTEESIKQRNKAAAGNAAVMGATDESVASAKAANNQALSDATSRIAAQADYRKDRIENSYLNKDNAAVQQLNEVESNKAQETVKAAQGLADYGNSIAENF